MRCRNRRLAERVREMLLLLGSVCLLLLQGCEPPDPRLPDGRPDSARTFALFCADCHGKDGRKGNEAMQLRRAAPLSDSELRTVIERGRNAMPGWKGRLKDDQLDAMAGYVRGFAGGLGDSAPKLSPQRDPHPAGASR